MLRQLSRLIQKYNIILHTLQSVEVCIFCAVCKMDSRPVVKGQPLVVVIIPCHPGKLRTKNGYVVIYKLRVSASYDKNAYPVIPRRQKDSLSPHRPAFTAASGTAESNILMMIRQEQRLLGVRSVYY